MPQQLQPFLHDLVATFAAPTQALSSAGGDIVPSADFPSAQGVLHGDIRVFDGAVLRVDGQHPEHIATHIGAREATFTSLLRGVRPELADVPDPQVRLDRYRRLTPGQIKESMTITSLLNEPAPVTLELTLTSDFATIEAIKVGKTRGPQPMEVQVEGGRQGYGDMFTWSHGDLTVRLVAPGADLFLSQDETTITLSWPVAVPARSSITVGWTASIEDRAGAVIAASGDGLDVAQLTSDLVERVTQAGVVDHRLRPWIEQSLADLNSLRMATPDEPDAPFFAAGAPWYLTLFGRDSLWTARLLLPVDLEHASGTLRTLARLQGTKIDTEIAEAPGKIMHELRRSGFALGEISLPPLYFGTIDATALWISLLHDAWLCGLDEAIVRELLPNLQAALSWLTDYADADGDGFVEYIDDSGHGLANQGWKDSGDSVRFADGTIALGPVALCEVQGYAFEAANAGATLLEAFGLDGADSLRAWASRLAAKFRTKFWCGSGEDRYPALALDGAKQRVDSVTSNIGHLIGTGLLSEDEELLVAKRISAPDMDSGLGLRTMSTGAGGYSPLSYHCGSVWPHDTAIVIAALARAGLAEYADGLIEGLLRASDIFHHRFPELWSGEGKNGVPYPAACRPQAWSAVTAVTVADALAHRNSGPA